MRASPHIVSHMATIGSAVRALRKAGAKNCGMRQTELDLIIERLEGRLHTDDDGLLGLIQWLGRNRQALVAAIEAEKASAG